MYSIDADLPQNALFRNGMALIFGPGEDVAARHAPRYQRLAWLARARGHRSVQFFSVPGRTELAGNHTDHSQGKVLAAAISLDVAAAVAPRRDLKVHFVMAGQPPIDIALDHLQAVREERGTLTALIRGTAARLKAQGHRIGGFELFADHLEPLDSELMSGVVEALLACVLDHFYNEGRIPLVDQALAGQYAKNKYFGKPCGLMDQITCARGGVVAVDFAEPQNPAVEHLALDPEAFGYCLVAVDTGGSIPEYSEDYSAIAWEMKLVAAALGRESLRAVDEPTLLAKMVELRPLVGDRPILRSLHFLDENARVEAQEAALREGRFQDFLAQVRLSSLSSFMWLQNIISPTHAGHQGITLGLALTERFLASRGQGGACRIHGAGFAGTIQAWLPKDGLEAYRETLEPLFGQGSVKKLDLRASGAVSF